MHQKFTDKRYYELAEKWMNGTITPDEEQEFAQWYNKGQDDPVIAGANFAVNEEAQRERMIATINWKDKNNVIKLRRKWQWAAAAALLIISTAGYFMLQPRQQPVQIAKTIKITHDVAPGSNKAILTLANGNRIILDDAKSGQLASQGAITIRKTANGEIVYDASHTGNGNVVTYNTMSTPRGGQYHLILADGTNVWLNAASSIKFPTAFNGPERRVEITGEAYFEVAHNAAKPFRVASNGQLVEVLGTHFNINAYADEQSVKTTLLEGKVKVSSATDNQIRYLQKGEQADLSANAFKVGKVNTEAVVAWKNGQFIFDGDDIKHVMRMIARWYNVDVVYNGTPVEDAFYGTVSRYNNVSDVLKLLQLTGKVHFSIINTQISVYK